MMELKAFSGLANTVSSEAIPDGGLVEALNVDIDDSGSIRRRRGMTRIDTGSFHSLFSSADGMVLVVKDGALCRLNDAMQATVIYPGVGRNKLHYEQVGDVVFAKSQDCAIRIGAKGDAQEWGVPHVPGMRLEALAGTMPEGVYQVAATYVRRADGLEGGVSEIQVIALPGNSAIAVTLPERPGYRASIYLSAPNGEVLFLADSGVTGSTVISSQAVQRGIPLRTVGKYPPTGRGPIGRSFGRIYIADGHVLWATDPGQYEQVTRDNGYRLFEGRITFIASVAAGVFVGTEVGVYFMAGPFDAAKLTQVSTQGAPEQTPQEIDLAYVLNGDQQGVGVLFMTDGGICVGLADGQVINLTNRQFEFPKASDVSVMYRKQDGLNQFVGVASHPGTPTGSARFGDFVDAEIVRHKGA